MPIIIFISTCRLPLNWKKYINIHKDNEDISKLINTY